jgi:hypothetical protein
VRFAANTEFPWLESEQRSITCENSLTVIIPWPNTFFETDGIDLFVDKYGQLINVSRHGQLEMKQLIAVYLRRSERDRSGYLCVNRGQW